MCHWWSKLLLRKQFCQIFHVLERSRLLYRSCIRFAWMILWAIIEDPQLYVEAKLYEQSMEKLREVFRCLKITVEADLARSRLLWKIPIEIERKVNENEDGLEWLLLALESICGGNRDQLDGRLDPVCDGEVVQVRKDFEGKVQSKNQKPSPRSKIRKSACQNYVSKGIENECDHFLLWLIWTFCKVAEKETSRKTTISFTRGSVTGSSSQNSCNFCFKDLTNEQCFKCSDCKLMLRCNNPC